MPLPAPAHAPCLPTSWRCSGSQEASVSSPVAAAPTRPARPAPRSHFAPPRRPNFVGAVDTRRRNQQRRGARHLRTPPCTNAVRDTQLLPEQPQDTRAQALGLAQGEVETRRSASTSSTAASEYQAWPPGVVRRGACHRPWPPRPATASGHARRRSLASYSRDDRGGRNTERLLAATRPTMPRPLRHLSPPTNRLKWPKSSLVSRSRTERSSAFRFVVSASGKPVRPPRAGGRPAMSSGGEEFASGGPRHADRAAVLGVRRPRDQPVPPTWGPAAWSWWAGGPGTPRPGPSPFRPCCRTPPRARPARRRRRGRAVGELAGKDMWSTRASR